ncbi:unnamed protein product [Diatraea saccharalis]|uniref:Reverse transcriptase domain-containing protein n=1 Tax=Diatraea saccharalis TaxID=40085 RepID=A0A9N9W8U5_9NEOP|nr:unnamed protein product [Diatraea saccharalis]
MKPLDICFMYLYVVQGDHELAASAEAGVPPADGDAAVVLAGQSTASVRVARPPLGAVPAARALAALRRGRRLGQGQRRARAHHLVLRFKASVELIRPSKAGSALVAPLVLQVSMGGGNHSPSGLLLIYIDSNGFNLLSLKVLVSILPALDERGSHQVCLWSKTEKTESSLGEYGLVGSPLEVNISVTALAFAPIDTESRVIAIGLETGNIRIYGFNTSWSLMREMDTSASHHLTVSRLSFRPRRQHPDRLVLASCGADHFLRIHEITLEFIISWSLRYCDNLTCSRVYLQKAECLRAENVAQLKCFKYRTIGESTKSAAKHPHWGSRIATTRGRQLKQAVDTNHLVTLSTSEPTHWPTDTNKLPDIIDFYICKGMSQYASKTDACLDGSSNHTSVLLTLSTTLLEYEITPKLYNKSTDWDSFREIIDRRLELKIALKTPDDIDAAATKLTNLIQVACWLTTSNRQNKYPKHNSVPATIRLKIQDKRRLRRVWHCSRLEVDKKALNKAIVELRELIKDAENKTITSYLESLTPTRSSDYSLWKATAQFNQPKRTRPPLKLQNCTWARTAQERVDAFANHLSNVFKPNEATNSEDPEIEAILNQDLQMDLPLKTTNPKEVLKYILKLDNKKAPGFDEICKEVLVQLPRKGLVYLSTLFNGIMRTGHFPGIWKVSEIIMIHKEGKPINEVSSYRPISLLPVISKLFEKILLVRMLDALSERSVIPDHQFGFRQEHGTVEQVHRVVDQIRKSLELKEYCSSAFLDIEQAFDRVWHNGLLCKIKTSLPHTFFGIVKSYLSERIFHVRDGEYSSNFYKIRAGVPQGSVLGPLLYTIFTSDLPETTGVLTATFADDTAILASSKNPEEANQLLQQELDKIEKWLKKWRIKASSSKSVHVTFTLRKEDCPPVKLEGKILPHQDTVKYLGMHLDRRLTWKNHLLKKRDQINIRYRNLQWLLGRHSVLSIDNKLLIYKVVLKPIWTYGIQLWGSACNSSIEIIQRAQNSILRNLSNAPWFIKTTELHNELGVCTVKDEIRQYSAKYKERLLTHPNCLAVQLTSVNYPKRLKRQHIIELSL